jgi:uncharacterized membrane protein
MSNQEAIIGIFADDPKKAADLQERYKAVHDELGISEAAAVMHEMGKDPRVTYMGVSKKKGAGAGAVAGALVGVVGGPVGMAFGAALGALGGATVVATSHIGINKETVDNIENALPEGGSAIIVLVEEKNGKRIINDLTDAGAKIVNDTVTSDQLEKASLISPSSGIAES